MDIQNHIDLLLTRLPYPYKRSPIGSLTEADLQAFTERTQIELPAEICAWFKITNGLRVGTQRLFGIRKMRGDIDDVESILKIFPSWKERGWLPIGTDGSGNYYVIPLRGDYGPGFPVFFVEIIQDENAPLYIAASDLEHFIRSFIEDEVEFAEWPPDKPLELVWPFDKEQVLRKDPAILNFTGVALPWEA